VKNFAFTLDLESEYAGYARQYRIFKEPGKIEKVLSALDSLGVKITVFVVGEIFENYPGIIRLFEKYNCEFEAHSYSHNIIGPDQEYEVSRSREAYFGYFRRYPTGYRAPLGKLSPRTIAALEKYGFLYDSSIFPSYYPDPLRYLFCNRDIHDIGSSGMAEIPVTSLMPLRLTLSLSYLKLFGIGFYLRLSRIFGLPPTVCFNSHLHDFIFSEGAYQSLPFFWKLVHGRNRLSGADFCVEFLEYVRARGYRFCYMSDIYKLYKGRTG